MITVITNDDIGEGLSIKEGKLNVNEELLVGSFLGGITKQGSQGPVHNIGMWFGETVTSGAEFSIDVTDQDNEPVFQNILYQQQTVIQQNSNINDQHIQPIKNINNSRITFYNIKGGVSAGVVVQGGKGFRTGDNGKNVKILVIGEV